MDTPTPKTDALDSRMLVTLTVEQLRELIRDEIQAARTAQQEVDPPIEEKRPRPTHEPMTAEELDNLAPVDKEWVINHEMAPAQREELGIKLPPRAPYVRVAPVERGLTVRPIIEWL